MLWAGATPEEIADLQFDEDDRSSLTQLKELTKLQVKSHFMHHLSLCRQNYVVLLFRNLRFNRLFCNCSDALQIRAFLHKLYRQSALSSMELNEVFNWMLELSPAGLQRFLVNDTDFSSLPSADSSRASHPTLKQVCAPRPSPRLFGSNFVTYSSREVG